MYLFGGDFSFHGIYVCIVEYYVYVRMRLVSVEINSKKKRCWVTNKCEVYKTLMLLLSISFVVGFTVYSC